MSSARTPDSKWLGWAAACLALAMLGLYSFLIRVWMLDDAFISFRYAENFARGDGFVYNIGEKVEGYTTFLWVLILGVCHRFGLDTVVASRWLGMGFAAANLLLVALSPRLVRGLDYRIAGAATLMLASTATFITWGMSGMEVTLTAFLLLGAVLLHLSDPVEPHVGRQIASGLLCALATMARPEMGLMFLVLLGSRWQGRRRGAGDWLPFAAAYAGLYAPYFLWRWSYYGWLLPNTFYAKVGSSWEQVVRGADYLTRWSGPTLLVLAPAIAGVLAGRRVARRHGSWGVIPVLLGVHLAYVAAVGGDGMPAFRFLAPIMPLLCIWAAISLVALAPSGRVVAAAVALTVAFNIWQSLHHPEMLRRVLGDRVARRGAVAGRWLAEHASPDATLATNTAGSIPYYAGLHTIDMLGLNDRHIAHRKIESLGSGVPGHEKSDGRYVLSRAPDFIQFDAAVGSKKPIRRGDREIYGEESFHRDYDFRAFQLPDGGQLRIWVRKSSGEPAHR